MATKHAVPTLQWTDDEAANRLIAEDPMALLIGFCLDQQITVEKAFMGPLVITQRLGTIDANQLARMNAARIEQAFVTPPAVHRFPASMAGRVHALCTMIASEYGGDAAAIWTTASDAADLRRRLGALPGFGPMKATIVLAVLVKRFGVKLPGSAELLPDWTTLADVRTIAERREYQANKRAHKARLRAQAAATPIRKAVRRTAPVAAARKPAR